MKILPQNVEKFISNLDINIKGILLYGPNLALIGQRLQVLIEKYSFNSTNQFALVDINFDKIKDNPNTLEVELNSLSFFTSKKLIKITQTSSSISKEICDVLSNINGNNRVIMIAGELNPNSSTRKFFENSKNFASIACYEDTESDIKVMISTELLKDGYKISKEALTILVERIPLNRSIALNELEKIKLFTLKHKEINLNDIFLCIENSAETSIEDFCQKFILKDEKTFNLYEFLIRENTDLISIIRGIIRYINKLLQILYEVESGKNISDAIKNITPTIFFKQVPFFTKAANLWNKDKLINLLCKLNELEIYAKTTASIHEILFRNFILNMIQVVK